MTEYSVIIKILLGSLRVNISLSAFASSVNFASRDGFGGPVQRQPAHLHTQAESMITSEASSVHAGAVGSA